MKIGFIGLGIMGSRMAANLQTAGLSLVVFNRTRAKAEPLLGSLRDIFRFAGKTRRASERVVHDAGSPGRGQTSSSGRERISGSSQAKRGLGRLQFGESVVLEKDGRRSSAPGGSFCRRAGDRLRSRGRGSEAHFLGWELIQPTWKEFVHCCCAWATKLFTPVDREWALL